MEKVDASLLEDASFSAPGGGKFDICGVNSVLSGKKGSDNAVLDVQVSLVKLQLIITASDSTAQLCVKTLVTYFLGGSKR